MGFLYTWDAATAGKGGVNGRGNIYRLDAANTNTNDESNWSYLPAQLADPTIPFPGNGGQGNYEWRIQGICPAGWHLPSDYEWTELENVIIKNTTDYAYVGQNISLDGMSNILDGTETGPRGWTLGQAMKEVCGVTATGGPTNGLSYSITQNGFNVLLAGAGNSGSVGEIDRTAQFWSSSSGGGNLAWYRALTDVDATVIKLNARNRGFLSSIRCKKD
ncbi:MAG: FISUMP domain-containing protein [Dysgonomonas sp.]